MSRLSKALRGTDEDLFDLFESAGDNVVRAAGLLEEMLGAYDRREEMTAAINACEGAGDRIVHTTIDRLNHTFVTPIEREDILQLSSVLDDIVDLTEEVAVYMGVYDVPEPTPQAQRMASILHAACREIAQAIRSMRHFNDIGAQTLEVHRLENEADVTVRDALGTLFRGDVDALVVIRWKDIYERLEGAIDATERAASILEGIVIKNS